MISITSWSVEGIQVQSGIHTEEEAQKKMVSIKDVAQVAGVSTATVSRVLADSPRVRAVVRDRVMAVVKELDYSPNRVARNLRSRKSNVIGLIVSDIENPFFHQVSRAVEDAAHEQGYSVMLCNNDEDSDKEKRYLRLLRDENVAGVILSPTRPTADNFAETSMLNIPMVVIDRRVNNVAVDNILIDNVQSAHTIVSHLIQHGHHRIGAIFGAGSTTGRERHEGYVKALKDHHIQVLSELVAFTNPREEDGFSTTLKLLKLAEPPDAILTSNSLLAAGALGALRENNVSIPDEIALASFDETTWTRLVVPTLTVIEQPTHEIGRTATELLIKRIQDPKRSNREVILKAKLIVRQSCGCQNNNGIRERKKPGC
jgi:DNA-binding LacI/PurR family transcriptional regulator